jgi:hypothetical protein
LPRRERARLPPSIRAERAAREREACKGVDECLRGRLVAAVLRGALVEVAVPAQSGEGAIGHA